MKLGKILFVFSWILIGAGLLLYFISNNIYSLIIIAIGLAVVSLSEYNSLKKKGEINYQSLRVIFVYIMGALFSLFMFLMSFIKNKY